MIVLEDDLVSSQYFLKFMNDALDLYKDDESVASIHGYVYPINDLPETFFLKVQIVGDGLHGPEPGLFLNQMEQNY